MVVNMEKDKPLVSFIVNCYNGERYLKSCLSSILDQTYTKWELIFWDNASTDQSSKIFNSYNDSRFKYFKSDVNVTLGQARAWAVDQCNGEYIAFLDVDDKWLPLKTEIQITEMLKDDYVLSYTSMIEVDDTTGKSRKCKVKYKSGCIFSENMFQYEINMPSSMIKRKALISKGLNFDPNIKASEEYCLYMQLIYNEKVCVIDNYLVKYLVRNDSLTNKSINYWAKERIYTLEKILDTHPDARQMFPTEFKEAFARAEYYKARKFMFENDRISARKCLKRVYSSGYRYTILYLLLFMPSLFWNKIHNIKTMRD
tara:strand:- start:2088 stop:3026 length:939 start_codon:yes stop_codon:yes gene_type:complete